MKHAASRGKAFFAIFSVLAIISFGTLCWAVPIGPYDFSITVGASYNTGPIAIGDTLTFDSWWDILDPVGGGQPWAGVYIQRPDPNFGWVTIEDFYNNVTSSDWAPNVIDTSAYAGQTFNILFSINDFGQQDPDPVYYVRNLSTNVPEPSTLLLLGSGLAGLAVYGRRRMKK